MKETDIHHLIEEETALLEKVRSHLLHYRGGGVTFSGYDDQLIELRDAIAEAVPEDLPSLMEQMARLQALASHRGRSESLPADPNSPYFGHMILREEDSEDRDVLLGKRTHLTSTSGINIVDWRNAPISRMYYSYEEGDDYEESFGGRLRTGVMLARRSVTIVRGILRRIDCLQGHLVRKNDTWVHLAGNESSLSGGQGTAVRSDSPGHLGVDAEGVYRTDKHLPEISGLLDKAQFSLISDNESDLMIVQGSAGSGKTTVALHRMAYLAYGDGRNIRPGRMVAVVLNRALANYISDVLPSLGVSGVRVVTFEDWASRQRRRHIPGLPDSYSDWTPSVVSRVKKHPAILRILEDIVDVEDERLTGMLEDSLADRSHGDRVMRIWRFMQRVPLDSRRRRLERWLEGEVRIAGDSGADLDGKTALLALSALDRMSDTTADVVTSWADLMTDRDRLRQMLDVHAPAEFSDGDVETVHDWCTRVYGPLLEFMDAFRDAESDARSKRGADDDADAASSSDSDACLDREDDAMLLRLYQLKIGWLTERGRRLEYEHLMVDEVQDFGALEVRVLMDCVVSRAPVTLAGDTAQRIVQEGGFDDWEQFLDDLGIREARIESLRVAYRSTAEVMQVAREILGSLVKDESVATRHGAPVEVHQFSDPGQAVDFLASALRDLNSREPLANVVVIARHLSQAEVYYQGFQKAEIPRLSLVRDQDFCFRPGVEVTDVRQVKGLEFDYVILVDCNADSYPLTDESRHLLHVGMTRAAHQLWLVTTGTPSPVIPPRLL